MWVRRLQGLPAKEQSSWAGRPGTPAGMEGLGQGRGGRWRPMRRWGGGGRCAFSHGDTSKHDGQRAGRAGELLPRRATGCLCGRRDVPEPGRIIHARAVSLFHGSHWKNRISFSCLRPKEATERRRDMQWAPQRCAHP